MIGRRQAVRHLLSLGVLAVAAAAAVGCGRRPSTLEPPSEQESIWPRQYPAPEQQAPAPEPEAAPAP